MLHRHQTINAARRASLLPYWIAMSLAIVTVLVPTGREAAADDDLNVLIDQARESFQPVSDEQLADARAELVKKADELQRFIVPSSTNGKNWNRYLKWDAVAEQLSSTEPMKLAPLRATHRQLNADHNGLELPQFRGLAGAIRDYLYLAVAARSTDTYDQQLDGLKADLDTYAANPTPELATAIGSRLNFIAGLGQAPELVAAVREKYARPNAMVNVAVSLLNDAAAKEPIERTDPVTDVILGTNIRGTSRTTGTLSVATVPSDDRAILQLTSTGHSEAQNRGTKGPAVIRSTAHTDFTATMRVELSDEAFRVETEDVDATTRSDVHSVGKQGGGFGKRIVTRVGWDKVHENHARADQIASQHSVDRVRRRMYDEVSEKIRDARQRYEDNYRTPLARRGQLPDAITFSTTDDALEIEVTQASGGQLAAPGAPPEAPEGKDVAVCLHQSAVNNYAAAVLGGVTASESEPGQKTKFDSPMPKWFKKALEDDSDQEPDVASDEPFKPWSLKFRAGQPISVVFVEGQIELTIHVAKLTSGDDDFDNWDVTGTFTPELAGGGVVLHRQGDLVVLPTGFDRASGKLSANQVAVRSNLTKVLNERSAEGRGFPQTITVDPLEPSGDLSRVGPLGAEQFDAGDGWLTMAWNRQ